MMSETPSIELVPMSSRSDISGQMVEEPPTIEPPTIEPPAEDTPTEPPEKDHETESEIVETEKPVNTDDDDLATVALGSILVIGGIILGGLALYMKNPVVIEHPWSRGDYF